MASTLISDVYVPEVYDSYSAVNGPEKTAFFESGIIASSPLFNELASGGGYSAEMPFWKDMDASVEPNYSSDDPTDIATPQKVTATYQSARKSFINQGYSSADLTAELAGSDPMQQVRNRFGTYWQRQWQRRLIATCNGVLANNIASDSEDMVNDISGATNAVVTTATKFSRAGFTGAAFTSGDHVDDYVAMAVHSTVMKTMSDNDDIDYMPDSEGKLTIPTFMGRRLIMDDSMPYTAAGGAGDTDTAPKYTSILFGAGAFGYGEGSARVPVELERQATQGNGGGVESLWERKQWIIHPFGHQWTEGTIAGESPSWAELGAAAHYTRIVERKLIPLAFLITNG